MNNKTILPFIFLFLISLSCLVSAETIVTLNHTSDIVQIKSLKYDPYPVTPGEYFDFWISVQYVGNPGSLGASFQLVPEYPFSLDSNDSRVRDFGTVDSPSVVLHYKVRVDKDAVEGTNTIKLNYNVGSFVYTQSFDIDVENPKTNFDAVVQQVSGSDVSIAIANTGKNVANSVIVKIPDQNDFITTGTNGQMVGNLNNGDYTVVSFTLSPKRTTPITSNSQQPLSSQGFQPSAKTLNFDIYYTDTIGERRIINMSLPLSMSAVNSSSYGNFRGRSQNQSLFAQWYFWVIFVVLIITGITVYKKNSKVKNFVNNLFSKIKKRSKKKNDKSGSTELPDWMKNLKEKEKK